MARSDYSKYAWVGGVSGYLRNLQARMSLSLSHKKRGPKPPLVFLNYLWLSLAILTTTCDETHSQGRFPKSLLVAVAAVMAV